METFGFLVALATALTAAAFGGWMFGKRPLLARASNARLENLSRSFRSTR